MMVPTQNRPKTGHRNTVTGTRAVCARAHRRQGAPMLSPRMAAKARALVQLLATLDVEPEALPIRDAVSRWMRTHVHWSLKPNTISTYEYAWQNVCAQLGDTLVTDLTPEVMSAYWGTVPRGSRTSAWSALSSGLNWMSKHGWPGVEECIPPRPRPSRRDAYLTKDDYPHAFRAVRVGRDRRWCRPRTHDCIMVGLLVPLRPSELLTLRWRDIDTRAGIIQLPDTKFGHRWAPCGRIGASIIASQPRVNEFVWQPGRKDGFSHLSLSGLDHAWARCRDRYAKTFGHQWAHPDVSPHGWRHSWATAALGAGIPFDHVRRVLGHSAEKMTEIYAHVTDRDLRSAVDTMQARLVAGSQLQLHFATS